MNLRNSSRHKRYSNSVLLPAAIRNRKYRKMCENRVQRNMCGTSTVFQYLYGHNMQISHFLFYNGTLEICAFRAKTIRKPQEGIRFRNSVSILNVLVSGNQAKRPCEGNLINLSTKLTIPGRNIYISRKGTIVQ